MFNCFFDQVPVKPNDIYSASKAIDFHTKGYLNNKDYRMVRFAEERINLINTYLNKDLPKSSILNAGCGTRCFSEAAQKKHAQCFGLELGKDLALFTANRLVFKYGVVIY